MIATSDHGEAVLAELRGRHFDVDRAMTAGDLLVLDARETLEIFMVDGMPSGELFKRHVPAAIERLSRGRKVCTIRAYGEMVDVLWQEGATVAALRLEMLWNQLAMAHDFALLCGYAMGSVWKDAGMREICAHHSHVISADNPRLPDANG